MNLQSHAYERCKSFIDANFVETHLEKPRPPVAVTISRQAFSHGHAIAEELIRDLKRDSRLGDSWALFDRDLVGKVLEDHNLPKTIARYMPEDRDREFTGLINELVGLHPSLWELFRHTCDTIYRLAKVGNVIVIGRGSHIITRSLPHVLHVRIIAPFEQRVETAARELQVSPAEAARMVRHDDQARAAFIRSHFDESWDDPLAYHLVINTGKLSNRAAAQLIHCALLHH